MIRLLADENFNNAIVRALKKRIPDVEIVRIQDTEMVGKSDPLILEWAASKSFVVLTHDVNTMRGLYYTRLNQGLSVPGLFLVQGDKPIGLVIESLELILHASDLEDWGGEITYLPL